MAHFVTLVVKLLVLASTIVTIGCANVSINSDPIKQSNRINNNRVTPNFASLTQYVRGQLVDKSGLPIAAATVYFPKYSLNDKKGISDYKLGSIPILSNACKKPNQPHHSFTCTDPNGKFHLHILGATDFPLQLNFDTQEDVISIPLALDDLSTDLGTIQFTKPQLQRHKIAIVMDLFNPFDAKDNVTPMGSTSFENNQQLVRGFYDYYQLDEFENEVTFPTLSSLFKDSNGDNKADIYQYKSVFLNSRGEEDMLKLTDDEKVILMEYVSNGGELMITTWGVQTKYSLDQYI